MEDIHITKGLSLCRNRILCHCAKGGIALALATALMVSWVTHTVPWLIMLFHFLDSYVRGYPIGLNIPITSDLGLSTNSVAPNLDSNHCPHQVQVLEQYDEHIKIHLNSNLEVY